MYPNCLSIILFSQIALYKMREKRFLEILTNVRRKYAVSITYLNYPLKIYAVPCVLLSFGFWKVEEIGNWNGIFTVKIRTKYIMQTPTEASIVFR